MSMVEVTFNKEDLDSNRWGLLCHGLNLAIKEIGSINNIQYTEEKDGQYIFNIFGE